MSSALAIVGGAWATVPLCCRALLHDGRMINVHVTASQQQIEERLEDVLGPAGGPPGHSHQNFETNLI